MNYTLKIDVDSMNIVAYRLKIYKKDVKIRKANPPIFWIIIHHTTVAGTIFHQK